MLRVALNLTPTLPSDGEGQIRVLYHLVRMVAEYLINSTCHQVSLQVAEKKWSFFRGVVFSEVLRPLGSALPKSHRF
jgi:hypothetical protein